MCFDRGDLRPTMGKALAEQSPLFGSVLQKCDKVLATLPDRPSWSIADEMRKSPDVSNVYKAVYAQPLCTALQLGVVILLRSWGISPTAVVGHSSGEVAAAYAAGLLSFEHTIIVAYYRGVFLDQTTLNGLRSPTGSMCAIGMTESNTRHLLEQYDGRLQLAAVNSPNSCTLSGDTDAIEDVGRDCVQRNIFCRRLRVDMGRCPECRWNSYADRFYQRIIPVM
jgi:acyl transferase domain-containing protein